MWMLAASQRISCTAKCVMITHVELTQSNSKTALAFQVVLCSSLQITTLITQVSDILQEWDDIGMLSMSSVAAGRLTKSA